MLKLKLLMSVCLFVLLMTVPSAAEAVTEIQDFLSISEDTVWTAENGPYLIGDWARVRVEEGVVLEIEPGTIVKLGDRAKIDVWGDLVAEGGQQNKIVFTSLKNDKVSGDDNNDGGVTHPTSSQDSWGLIVGKWNGSGVSHLTMKNVEISYALTPIWADDVVSVLENVTIHDSMQGPGFYGGDVEIQNLWMYDIDYYGAMFFRMGNVSIEHVIADSLETGLEVYNTAALQVDGLYCIDTSEFCLMAYKVPDLYAREVFVGESPINTSYAQLDLYGIGTGILDQIVVETISDRDQSAVGVYNSDITITNSEFLGGAGTGIEVYGFRDKSSLTLSNVDIENFEIGIDASIASVRGDDVRFRNNEYGAWAYTDGDDEFVIHNSLFENNGTAVVNDDDVDAKQIDLRENWWGSESGPYHAALNPAGAGDAVVGDVLFDPWLTESPEEEKVEVDPLLLQYAPKLQFHEDEMYFPMNVEPFIEASALWTKEGIPDSQLVNAEDLTVERFEEIAGTTDTSDYYLAYSDPDGGDIDLTSAFSKYTAMVESGAATSTVYGYRMEDCYTDDFEKEHCFIVLQYWYFYAMNNWGEQGGFNNHEGDWESVFIFLDKLTKHPEYVAYSAHHNDGNPSFNPIQYDSVRREWGADDVEKNSDTVTSFVALGSHANYYVDDEYEVFTPLGVRIDDINDIGEIKEFQTVAEILEKSTLVQYFGLWGIDSLVPGSDGPAGPINSNVSGIERFWNPIEWAGIDKISEYVIENETTTVAFSSQGVTMEFAEALSEGTSVKSTPHNEIVYFGTNLDEVNLLPQYWDLSTSLQNDSFSVEVTLPLDTEVATVWGLDPQFMSVYHYNEQSRVWEIVPTTVSESSVTFTTTHFSKYAIGAPRLTELEGVTVSAHPKAYSQENDTRTYAVSLGSDTELPAMVRAVVTDLEEGVLLLEPDGFTTSGLPYVDMSIPVGVMKFETELAFELPTNVPAADNANGQAQKENATSKQVTFGIKNYSKE